MTHGRPPKEKTASPSTPGGKRRSAVYRIDGCKGPFDCFPEGCSRCHRSRWIARSGEAAATPVRAPAWLLLPNRDHLADLHFAVVDRLVEIQDDAIVALDHDF